LSVSFDSLEETKKITNIGYGVMNVQARIKLTYGESYGLYIESNDGKGTTVKIVLPLK
jgi:two-component system, sensor histidine kinase YesM